MKLDLALSFNEHRVCPYCLQENAVALAGIGPLQVISCAACGGMLSSVARRITLGAFRLKVDTARPVTKELPVQRRDRKQGYGSKLPIMFVVIAITMFSVKYALVAPNAATFGVWALATAAVCAVIGYFDLFRLSSTAAIFGAALWLAGPIILILSGMNPLGAQVTTLGTFSLAGTILASNAAEANSY